MKSYSDVRDPNAAHVTVVNAISSNGAFVTGHYVDSAGVTVGFVENIATQTYASVIEPNAVTGTSGVALSADGTLLAGSYVNSAFQFGGFVENLNTHTFTEVSDPNAVSGTVGGLISADGTTLAGYYLSGSSLYAGRVGFVENLATQTYTTVSDPNVTSGADGGTVVTAISAKGAVVAGTYVGASVSGSFVENVATQTYVNVSAPQAAHGTTINAISADGGTVAGYYIDANFNRIGFVEIIATGVYDVVKEPNTATDTYITALSADGTKAAGYYVGTSVVNNAAAQTNIGFLYDLKTNAFTDIADPNAVGALAFGGNPPGVNSTNNGTIVTGLSADGATVTGYYYNSAGDEVGFVASDAACYARGTHILTARGEVAVESLRVGDLVVTASGPLRPIRWIGWRKVDCARHPHPQNVWPIRVRANAFARNTPARDLWLSPGHNIEVEGHLMPIEALANGGSVAQIEQPAVEYWHIELDAHDIVVANGLNAESYLDTGNRAAFANGGAFIEAHPDFRPRNWADTCLPLALEGPQVARAKARLLERFMDEGHELTCEADLHILANGQRVEASRFGATSFAFRLPIRRRDIRLVSRTFVPSHVQADSADLRRLGVCVGRLQIDGADVPLDAAPSQDGWHDSQPGHRWTRGEVVLPANARIVVIDLAGEGVYWREDGETLAQAERRASA